MAFFLRGPGFTFIRGLLLEKATNEATINHLRQDLAAHKTHMQALAYRLDQVHFDTESKCKGLLMVNSLIPLPVLICRHVMLANRAVTDNLEIQDLKDCLLLEREEKNELHQKFRELEKECMCSVTFVHIGKNLSESGCTVHPNARCSMHPM